MDGSRLRDFGASRKIRKRPGLLHSAQSMRQEHVHSGIPSVAPEKGSAILEDHDASVTNLRRISQKVIGMLGLHAVDRFPSTRLGIVALTPDDRANGRRFQGVTRHPSQRILWRSRVVASAHRTPFGIIGDGSVRVVNRIAIRRVALEIRLRIFLGRPVRPLREPSRQTGPVFPQMPENPFENEARERRHGEIAVAADLCESHGPQVAGFRDLLFPAKHSYGLFGIRDAGRPLNRPAPNRITRNVILKSPAPRRPNTCAPNSSLGPFRHSTKCGIMRSISPSAPE